MYGLWFSLLGLNSSPSTSKNPRTTSSLVQVRLFIYIYCVFKE